MFSSVQFSSVQYYPTAHAFLIFVVDLYAPTTHEEHFDNLTKKVVTLLYYKQGTLTLTILLLLLGEIKQPRLHII